MIRFKVKTVFLVGQTVIRVKAGRRRCATFALTNTGAGVIQP